MIKVSKKDVWIYNNEESCGARPKKEQKISLFFYYSLQKTHLVYSPRLFKRLYNRMITNNTLDLPNRSCSAVEHGSSSVSHALLLVLILRISTWRIVSIVFVCTSIYQFWRFDSSRSFTSVIGSSSVCLSAQKNIKFQLSKLPLTNHHINRWRQQNVRS